MTALAPDNANGAPKQPVPVTLLSGFLGAGKTTLLRHILTSPTTNLRIAVIVNDMAALNIDAALIKKHVVSQASEDENLIQLQNGCICCTLRGDLLESLVRIAREGVADYIVIESTGISEPMQVAETFTGEFVKAMVDAVEGEQTVNIDGDEMVLDMPEEHANLLREINDMGGLHKLVRLDNTTTMVDGLNFFDNFATTEFITDRWGKEGVDASDERSITDLLVDQLEFANTVIINKIDTVPAETIERIRGVVKSLNPLAKILVAKFADVDLKQVLETNAFDFEKAATGMGWLQSLHEMSKREVNGKVRIAPKPETEEYGISSFVYRARKPFHPKRLYQLVHDKFVMMEDAAEDNDDDDDEEEEDEDEEMDEGDGRKGSSDESELNDDESWQSVSDDELNDADDGDEDLDNPVDPKQIALNKSNDPAFRGLIRSKGFFWLATRPNFHGAWSQAGAMLTLQGGDQWFCTLDEADWPPGEATKKSIKADFQKPWGDRRQELVLIGEKLDKKGLERALNGCLLNQKEMKKWEAIMRSKGGPERVQKKLDDAFEDGFQDWPGPMEEDHGAHEGHNHAGHRH